MNRQINALVVTTSMIALVVSWPVHAQQAEIKPAVLQPASVILPSSRPATLRWTGRGNVRDGVPVCVSSPTGRYELSIQTTSGQGLTGEMVLPYTIEFEAAGEIMSGVLSRSNPVVRFSGQVDPDRTCGSGPNARLVVSLASDQAMAGIAGTYNDQISVSIEAR